MSFARAFRSEVRRIRRTPIDLALLTIVPAVLLGLMAAMISPGAFDSLRVVIVDRDGGPVARKMVRNVVALPRIEVMGVTPEIEDALSAIRREDAVAALVIPRGIGDGRPGRQPVEIFYEAQFLAAGSFASNSLQSAARDALAWGAAVEAPGGAEIRRVLPGVHVTLLGNPTLSVEWYLGLLLGPGILHLIIAITAIASVGTVIDKGSFATFARGTSAPGLDLAGRLLPHVLAGTLWGVLWFLWLTVVRGYWFEGSMLIVAMGLLMLFLATVGIGILLLALTKELATSLSGAVIITGSALAYSGASFPSDGASSFVRIWSTALPLTHYLRLQMDEVMGTALAPAMAEIAILLLYPLLTGGLAIWMIARSGRAQA
ncbi:ABC transporter permease [Sphingomonas kyeonggiensis]|uniref:ABC-2 type transport system permease protein n=1 Tax=Sphingomonas kyeonggiensis TaxID=1268553 RepID=A0A7W6NWY2_9SPHN|nr:ABC transporter permease [Sphingomonas kyeonggiensis]MBB4097974.1 ABC-2 type transport system permease protein [Sphingomonas kyeonggiensis]